MGGGISGTRGEILRLRLEVGLETRRIKGNYGGESVVGEGNLGELEGTWRGREK